LLGVVNGLGWGHKNEAAAAVEHGE
jgi:hypothetical protein